ncbi:MAG: hypothetical protein BGO87_13730 [Flavobacteriia bacterium 40-80]|nr:MAG: hypothetical protein BGO87_13730 [Flavobacteriia bacterium 40-80]
MNLYSNKQKWKIFLLFIALLLMGISIYFSNSIVDKVRIRERERAKNWADAIKKKAELVQLTNHSFSELKNKEKEEMELWIEATISISRPTALEQDMDYEFPLKIISKNKKIPVIVTDQFGNVASHINLKFDENSLQEQHPEWSKKEVKRIFQDSLKKLSKNWIRSRRSFTIEVYDDLFMTYAYGNSFNIERLEFERDSLIQAFNQELIQNKNLVPILLVDKEADTIIATNLPTEKTTKSRLQQTKSELSGANTPIELVFSNAQNSVLYYDKSFELKQLQYYPYIQFSIIGLFIFIAYLIFSTFRKAEQNQVWAGMAKETAHQLGTPLSSLIAWVELLDAQGVDESIVKEMRKDVVRLETVTNRFSKIGSETLLDETNIITTVRNTFDYIQNRVSSKIAFHFSASSDDIQIPHNRPLMEWVVENVIKNAVDAMRASGRIDVHLSQEGKSVYIDISDTGKGILQKDIKNIFKPGFTTKKRGWGLGLSLVKRIITEYHKGKISVLKTEVDKGTTFRIILYK